MKTPFRTEHSPAIGVPEVLREGLRVITAPNAGPMTFTGTRTYLLGEGDVAVIDPGPDDPDQLAAIEKALEGQNLGHIIVTHAHVDHSPLAARLSARSGAPVYGYGPANAGRSEIMEHLAALGGLGGGEGIDEDFTPDILVRDGERIVGQGWALEAIHTPGHLSNHLCFAWEGQGALFSGDHVMGWASTLVSPPDGDLTAFMESLRKLQNRPEDTYYCGHGDVLEEAHTMLEYLLAHRLGREDQIRSALAEGLHTVPEITGAIYTDVPKHLHPMAERNVLAHLIDLVTRKEAVCEGPIRFDGQFAMVG